MSYGPFLGGKRVCLGKTFAENIAKTIVPNIISQVKFRFLKPIHYEEKPIVGTATEEI
jgi:cytochrome P450